MRPLMNSQKAACRAYSHLLGRVLVFWQLDHLASHLVNASHNGCKGKKDGQELLSATVLMRETP